MLAHDRTGSGEPLLLIHGIGHRRQAWRPVVDRLAEHHEVITVDLPGHGASPAYRRDGRTASEILHDAFAELYDGLGLDRPHVVGNSLGGLIALELAAQGRASTVTALSPAGFWADGRDFLYVRGLFTGIIGAALAARPVAPRLARTAPGKVLLYSWLTAHPTRIDSDAAVEDYRALVGGWRTVRGIFADGGVAVAPAVSAVPTTIAWGTRDVVLLPYQARRARRLLPEANHVRLKGCGHVPMSDDPELVARIILEQAAQRSASHIPTMPGSRPSSSHGA